MELISENRTQNLASPYNFIKYHLTFYSQLFLCDILSNNLFSVLYCCSARQTDKSKVFEV